METNVPLIFLGREIADRRRVILKCVFSGHSFAEGDDVLLEDGGWDLGVVVTKRVRWGRTFGLKQVCR